MCLLDYEFDGDYELMLVASGRGRLAADCFEDEEQPGEALEAFREEYDRLPRDISLELENNRARGHRFTEVDPAFLEELTALKELILPSSVTRLEVTPALEGIFRGNSTLIRGSLGSFAQEFARRAGLHFRPSDLYFARIPGHGDELTYMTLVWGRDGSVAVRQEVSSSGSAAGNTFGGTFFKPLEPDFFRKMTPEQVAALFPSSGSLILEDGRLAAFMEQARSQDIYLGPN